MKILLPIVPMVILILNSAFSCEEELKFTSCASLDQITASSTLEEDQQLLTNLYTEIEDLIDSYTCENGNDWTFTPIGAKPCGGPTAYIAYPKSFNRSDFLQQINCYTELTDKFNVKHGIFSTCEVTPKPISVTCENGNPVLVY